MFQGNNPSVPATYNNPSLLGVNKETFYQFVYQRLLMHAGISNVLKKIQQQELLRWIVVLFLFRNGLIVLAEVFNITVRGFTPFWIVWTWWVLVCTITFERFPVTLHTYPSACRAVQQCRHADQMMMSIFNLFKFLSLNEFPRADRVLSECISLGFTEHRHST